MFFKSKKVGPQGLATPERIAAIFEKMKQLNAVDLSTLEAASKNVGDGILTAEGSPNDQLWSAMEKVGWAENIHWPRNLVPASSSGDEVISMKQFSLLESGKEPISRLLKELFAESVRKPEGPQVEGMDLANDFISKLRQSIIDNGGGMPDFAILIAFTVSQAAHHFVASENKQRWVDEISKISKSMIIKMEKNEMERSAQ